MVEVTNVRPAALSPVKAAAESPTPVRRGLGLPFWLSLAWLVIVAGTAALAPWLGLPDPARIDFLNAKAPPSAAHWFGTDVLGRDLLSRTIYGARVSLLVGLFAPAIGMAWGLVLGMSAGYLAGRLDAVVVGAIDTLLAIPGLVILLICSLVFGGSLTTVSLGLGLLFIPVFTRIARANTLAFARRDFVTAARALGAGDVRILLHSILPNVLMPVLAYALVAVATAIVAEGALSFLGLSVPSPTPSWGGSIAEGREYLEVRPHISVLPAAVMFLTVLSFNLVGDTVRVRLVDVRSSVL